jgi:hypothetical protein
VTPAHPASTPEREPLANGSGWAPLRGLSAKEADEGAARVLARVPWDGLPADPDTLSARDFLALL